MAIGAPRRAEQHGEGAVDVWKGQWDLREWPTT